MVSTKSCPFQTNDCYSDCGRYDKATKQCVDLTIADTLCVLAEMVRDLNPSTIGDYPQTRLLSGFRDKAIRYAEKLRNPNTAHK